MTKTHTYKHGKYWKLVPTEELIGMVLEWRDMAVGLLYSSGAEHVVYYGDGRSVNGHIVLAHFMMVFLDGDEYEKFVADNRYNEIGVVHASDRPILNTTNQMAGNYAYC